MKKIIRLICILAVLFTFIGTCSAEFQPNPKRWVWITSNSERSLWYDKYTVSTKIEDGRRIVRLWVLCYSRTPEENYSKQIMAVDITNKKLRTDEGYVFDMDNNMIAATSDKEGPMNWMPVIPETVSEHIYMIAKRYVPKKHRIKPAVNH